METSVSCVSYVSTFLQRIMDKSSVKETFDLLSLVEKDTTLRKSGAYHIGPCPFCGGCDRFTLKNTPDGWLWHCRKCGSDKYQDAIAYVMKHDNLTFTEALRSMGGETVAKQDRTRADKHKAKPINKPKIEIPPEEWQQEAEWFHYRANTFLLSDKQAEPGREYLQERGIILADWCRELLGFVVCDPKAKVYRPAIVIPHLDNCWKLTAVKLRLIDDSPQGFRYISRKGSKPLLWGLHTTFDKHETLVLVEGELNAISIRHCIPVGVSILSFGSENLTPAQVALLPILARKYERVIVWTDKGEKAREAQTAIGKRCELLKSPYGQDANDLLKAGLLAEFMKGILPKSTLDL